MKIEVFRRRGALMVMVSVVNLLDRQLPYILIEAILAFCILLVGASVGPFAVGWLSDQHKPQMGAEALRYVLCGGAIFMAWSALHFFLAGRTMARDLASSAASDADPELPPR